MNEEELELLNYVFRLAVGECYSEEIDDICKLQEKIINLNNMMKRYKTYLRKELEFEGYSDTFIKHKIRELKEMEEKE